MLMKRVLCSEVWISSKSKINLTLFFLLKPSVFKMFLLNWWTRVLQPNYLIHSHRSLFYSPPLYHSIHQLNQRFTAASISSNPLRISASPPQRGNELFLSFNRSLFLSFLSLPRLINITLPAARKYRGRKQRKLMEETEGGNTEEIERGSRERKQRIHTTNSVNTGLIEQGQ